MPEEVGVILDNLENVNSSIFGDLELFSGELVINPEKKFLITTAWSGWGKVSAARATTRLLSSKIDEIPIDLLIFTGVAGAVDKRLKQWDIVISESLIQHDMDARPLFDKYVIPALKNKKILSNKILTEKIFNSLNEKIRTNNFGIFGSIYKGLIATGDMFISDKNKINELSREIPEILAVEMEGAAFAQVSQQENVEWIVIRVISDGADEGAHDDFTQFLKNYKDKSFDLINLFLESLSEINF